MQQYLDLLRHILDRGTPKPTRAKLESTGAFIDAISVFGYQTRYDLSQGFPAVTTKRLWFHGVKHELLWMLSGSTKVEYLHANKVHLWDQWAKEGDIGPGYGKQMRAWAAPDMNSAYRREDGVVVAPIREMDQIQGLIDGIRETVANPRASVGRRIILNLWNVADIEKMGLPPCHAFTQFSVTNGVLSCEMYQRSADAFLGVPFNIAQYALLTHLLAQVTGLKVGEFIHSFGDLHIYENHIEQVREQLSREPKPLSKLWLNPEVKDLFAFTGDDIKLVWYEHHPALNGEVAV